MQRMKTTRLKAERIEPGPCRPAGELPRRDHGKHLSPCREQPTNHRAIAVHPLDDQDTPNASDRC